MQKANNIHNAMLVDNEIRHIRKIDAILKLAVEYINNEIDYVGFLDEDLDSDCLPFEESTIEFPFLDIRIWIDLRIQNDSCEIECVDVKDKDDNDYLYIARMLRQDLSDYYNKESVLRAQTYNQSVEIQSDQSDPYNLRPKMPLGYEVNSKYIQDLKSICEDEDAKISMFLMHGYTANKLKLKKNAKSSQIVRIILPIVKSGTFDQVNLLSDNRRIATLIYDNFKTSEGRNLNIRTLQNNISKSITAC